MLNVAGAPCRTVEEATGSEDLLERAQRGDVAAFEKFYLETVGGLLRWFRQRTAAGDVAADLCAETYSKALASLSSYDASRAPAPSAWLYGIAKNELGTYARRLRVADSARRRLGVEVGTLHEDDLDLLAIRVDLEQFTGPFRDGMHSLSEKLRLAVTLRVVEQLPYSEVARRAGCSEVAARARVARGLSQLWEQLGEGADRG